MPCAPSGLAKSVWVPPFANDSGSALGAACAELFVTGRGLALDWDVYAGPAVRTGHGHHGWATRQCSVGDLATLLHATGDPVVFLQGRAEIGPRALGNRSILAPATDAAMKGRLNSMKRREPYRPVSPICLIDRAAEIFDPGLSDPYMLFDHRIRPTWTDRIPAVRHLDGTARLQTVSHQSAPRLAALLEVYEARSGVPVLCNTSANLNGRGFFPDVESAVRWGEVDHVWCEGVLHTRQPHHFDEALGADARPLTSGTG